MDVQEVGGGRVDWMEVQKTSRQITSKFPSSYSVIFSHKIAIVILSAMENLILHFYRYNKQMEAETFGIVT
jgi:hypothetical protein